MSNGGFKSVQEIMDFLGAGDMFKTTTKTTVTVPPTTSTKSTATVDVLISKDRVKLVIVGDEGDHRTTVNMTVEGARAMALELTNAADLLELRLKKEAGQK